MINKRKAARRLLRSVLTLGLLSAQVSFAQVTLNFVNADIDQVAKAIGAATHRTIIVDPRVKGQINLVSEKSVNDDEALKTLQSALRMQGFALVQDHGVLKVVPEADAKLQGVPTFVGNRPVARGDQVITQVFQLHHDSANNLLPVLRPLISPNNTIAAYPANNTLVVTDYADNVRRIATIIAGIDSANGDSVEVVPLHNANAVDLAAQVQKMLDPGAIGNTDPTIKVNVTADGRTNSLLLRASSPARLKEAKKLVAKLDSPTREPGNIHVVPLRNADATQLAKTLRGMFGQNGGGASGQQPSSFSSGVEGNGLSSNTTSTGTAGLPPLPGGASSGGLGGGGLGGSTSAAGGMGQGGLLGSKEHSGDDNQPGGIIQADRATNSLIITAPEPVYRNLRNVIDQLDARRAQVYIESLIVELTSNQAEQFGIQWQGALSSGSGNNIGVAGTNFTTNNQPGSNIINLTTGAYAAGQGGGLAALPVLPNGLNVGLIHRFGSILGLGGLLQALDSVADVNVLSTPNMITLDNEEAKIVIGQNVPFITGSYAQTGATATVTPFQTYERQDVGITLHVKPQITEGGVIKLALYQEDSSVVPGSQNNQGGVTLNKRSIQSTVLADDGQIIVLGGLLQDSYGEGNDKVPWLGNVPVLGHLFRAENKSRQKTNLMVFLRPIIVRDAQASQDISLNRYDYMRSQSTAYNSTNWSIRDRNLPIVPPAPAQQTPGALPVPGVLAPQVRDVHANPGTPPATPVPGGHSDPASVNGYAVPQRSSRTRPLQPDPNLGEKP